MQILYVLHLIFNIILKFRIVAMFVVVYLRAVYIIMRGVRTKFCENQSR
jgi:hypothetical protein